MGAYKMVVTIPLLMLLVMLTTVLADDYHRVNVYATFDEKTNRFQIKSGLPTPDSLAWAQFINAVNETGWGLLELSTNTYEPPHYNDSMRAYAAGLVEGYITRELIALHWENTQSDYCPKPYSPYCQRLRDFLEENLNWVRRSITDNLDDPFWHQVEMFYAQLRGLTDGYKNDPSTPSLDIDPFGLHMLQLSDDIMYNLEAALHKPGVENTYRPGHSSVLIKMDPVYGSLLIAHSTWNSYTDLLRVLKKYNLQYGLTNNRTDEFPPGSTSTFSSYPGYLVSSDDFNVLSSFMVTLDTTILNNNTALYQHIKSEGCLFEPVRAWVANRLANNGLEWVKNFTRYNSGTYNNQWMVTDHKLIQEHPPPGVLTIVEQLPGHAEYADVTDVLKSQLYWASYDVAYLPKIFNMSGQQKLVDKYGDYFTHDMCPRAQIFRRDQHKVYDKESMFKLMSYNDFKNDPLSRCNCTPPYSAGLAISARADLNSRSGTYPFYDVGYQMFGGIDVKIVATGDMQWLLFDALVGPTYDQQPPFQWSKVDEEDQVPHYGQPDLFKFKPISFNGTVIPPFTPSWYKEN